MTTRTCLGGCGTSLEGEHPRRLRCNDCQRERVRAKDTARRAKWSLAGPEKRLCADCQTDISGEHGARLRCDSCVVQRKKKIKADADRRRQLQPKPTLECEPVSEEPWDEADWQDEPPKPPPTRTCADCGRGIDGLPDYVQHCAPCQRKRYVANEHARRAREDLAAG